MIIYFTYCSLKRRSRTSTMEMCSMVTKARNAQWPVHWENHLSVARADAEATVIYDVSSAT